MSYRQGNDAVVTRGSSTFATIIKGRPSFPWLQKAVGW